MTSDTFVPIFVNGETVAKALAVILRANGFALRCDIHGRTVAEPISPGIFALVRRDNLPPALPGDPYVC